MATPGGQPMLPAGLTPDISTGQTDIQNILLLNILNKTTDNAEFQELIKMETSYLNRALMLLRANPILRMRFGGYGLDAGNALAKELKARTDVKEIDMILEKPVRQAVSLKYGGGFKEKEWQNKLENPLKPYRTLFLSAGEVMNDANRKAYGYVDNSYKNLNKVMP